MILIEGWSEVHSYGNYREGFGKSGLRRDLQVYLHGGVNRRLLKKMVLEEIPRFIYTELVREGFGKSDLKNRDRLWSEVYFHGDTRDF